MTSENAQKRNYKHEYEIRKKRDKRIYADIDKNKVDAIKSHLKGRGLSFAKWLTKQIDNEIGGK